MNITNVHQGNLVLEDDLDLSGMVCGQLTVSAGCTANVHGTVTGLIFVEEGGVLILSGMATGGLTNRGGRVDIYGVVSGGLNKISGITNVHTGAIVS